VAVFAVKINDLFSNFVNMLKKALLLVFIALIRPSVAQLMVARDTINVIENGKTLKMAWGNGINHANVSNIDLNYDGKMDIVAFDRINLFGVGRFRCFVQTTPGTYTANTTLSYSFPFITQWAVCLDFDGDAKVDIFCSTSAGIMVYRNTGSIGTGLQFTLFKSLIYTKYGPTVTNLYAASNGIPGISDIDGDSDLDVLTFSPAGVIIEYHKNMSVETYGHNDSLDKFEAITLCWGDVVENNCSISTNQTCTPVALLTKIKDYQDKILHSGSCLTCIDTDSDGDKDLLIGDISCNIALYGHNTGSPSNALLTQTTNAYPNFPANSNTVSININNFPCSYLVEVDADGKKDLIACPNVNGGENTASMWYYRNASATPTVDFQLIKKNLFQDEMIEVGQGSFPVLFDENGDGKKDLLVGTHGYYLNGSTKGRLTLYRNIGTNTVPSFSLITRDYASVSSQSLNGAMPTLGDVDGDNDLDMIIGNMTGQIYLLTNTAGSLAPCSFSINPTALFTTTSAIAAPQLFDIDQDGKLDLMIGCKNGRIFYYRNIGTPTVPSWTLANGAFGGVNVKGDPNYFSIDGYAAPFFYKEGNLIKLLVGSISGQLFYYSVPSATAPCNLINANTNSMNEGGQSTVFYEDINGDNIRDLFIGNGSGGLCYFSSTGPGVSVKEEDLNANAILLFPNPAQDKLHIRLDKIELEQCFITIHDLLGKTILKEETKRNDLEMNISELQQGVYIVELDIVQKQKHSSVIRKLIVE